MGAENQNAARLPLVVDMKEAAAALGMSVHALRQRMQKDETYLAGWSWDGRRKVWPRRDFEEIVNRSIFEKPQRGRPRG